MRFAATRLPLLIAATASVVVGQTSNSKTCAAQNVVDRCVQDMQFQLEGCDTYDFACQCTRSTNVVDCYNNCPDLIASTTAQSIRQQNCANAKAYATTTTFGAAPSQTATGTRTHPHNASATSSGTPSGLEENNAGADYSDSGSETGSGSETSNAAPTKTLTGLQGEITTAGPSPTSGAAMNAVKRSGTWVAFLGLALGVMM
ncbi:Uncharacterized protein PECH_007337 [Penicillium ucsense]|uniref:GPI anchored serine-threonine rich protein n=1 Tax=Penicillium ucsense TaxID=2839758 RepID=A0A8J8WEG0_9EURO|nr:Uncharacterized protein PECM_002214 [Penicillium ucsense]KAF7734968.1 Uncharacterized protein PECH_007337 [Penicillium ucsense]